MAVSGFDKPDGLVQLARKRPGRIGTHVATLELQPDHGVCIATPGVPGIGRLGHPAQLADFVADVVDVDGRRAWGYALRTMTYATSTAAISVSFDRANDAYDAFERIAAENPETVDGLLLVALTRWSHHRRPRARCAARALLTRARGRRPAAAARGRGAVVSRRLQIAARRAGEYGRRHGDGNAGELGRSLRTRDAARRGVRRRAGDRAGQDAVPRRRLQGRALQGQLQRRPGDEGQDAVVLGQEGAQRGPAGVDPRPARRDLSLRLAAGHDALPGEADVPQPRRRAGDDHADSPAQLQQARVPAGCGSGTSASSAARAVPSSTTRSSRRGCGRSSPTT